jgi:hypothetical protein
MATNYDSEWGGKSVSSSAKVFEEKHFFEKRQQLLNNCLNRPYQLMG